MFTRKDNVLFFVAGFLIATGYILMALDPAENGFGALTLWIAPPLLLTGFLLPALGLIDLEGLPGVDEWKSQKIKHLAGLFIFLVAFLTYLCTLEPTASLWDCSEFIASAYKLQVPHTPGTPLSLLVGRLFSMISFGDVSKVAWTINLMSGFFSALTVTLVYYIICYLGTKLPATDGRQTHTIIIFSAGAGSLCLAFSDTFWFSAVEAETYGAACFFLVLIVWLILKGKELEGPLRCRRLILIFYLAGLAYCIHPMCLLALSVLPFAWCTHKKKLTYKNVFLSISAGFAIILFINRFVAVGIFELAFSFDRFLINQLHLPFYSGAATLLLLLFLFFRIILSRLKNTRTYVYSIIFLLLGFTPYIILFVRSGHNPPIDESNPENLALIKAYMNREGYPSSPLLYGPYFDAKIQDVTVDKKIFFKAKDRYEVAGALPSYQYDSRQTFLPRMYSNDPAHIETYRKWTGLGPHEKPSFSDNLQFLFSYQLGHMYLRYLMWNFAGRESDVQNSDWLKPWERISSSKFEKARNQHFMIPFILALAGAIVQYRKDRKEFVTMAIYFLITGIVLTLYLNSPPNEPRERDYIYVGSYIGFSIWVGLGVLSLARLVSRTKQGVVIAASLSLGVPLWMLVQNFDDHNRSGRTFQVDNARNILAGCAPNALLFTGGDNDTFPLWYLQEVEGFRTDVRVMVLSYMNTDWYINQLRKTYYDSGAFKLTLDEKDYRQYGPNDVLYIEESIKEKIDVKQYLRLLKDEHPALTRISRNGEPYHILPSRKLKLAAFRHSKTAGTEDTRSRKADSELIFTITENYVSRNLLAILDLIISNEWQRPIYFNYSSLNTVGTDLAQYVVQEGLLYRLTPERHAKENIAVNTQLTYKSLIELADYSNLQDSGVHFNYEDYHARMIVPIRQSFNSLALAFLEEGNPEMAEQVLKEAMDKLYLPHLRPSYTNLQAAQILQVINKNQMADEFSKPAFDYYYDNVRSFLRDNRKPDPLDEYLLRQSAELLAKSGRNEFLEKVALLGI